MFCEFLPEFCEFFINVNFVKLWISWIYEFCEFYEFCETVIFCEIVSLGICEIMNFGIFMNLWISWILWISWTLWFLKLWILLISWISWILFFFSTLWIYEFGEIMNFVKLWILFLRILSISWICQISNLHLASTASEVTKATRFHGARNVTWTSRWIDVRFCWSTL